jgi:ASC-1-like (ASCH) protein
MIELTFEDEHFQDIKNGKKTVIGKIDADLQGIKKGDTVIFKDVSKNSSEKIIVKVKDIKKFSDVPTMLKEMKLKTILPRSRTYKDGEKVFEETYGNKLKGAKFTAFTFDIQSIPGPRIKDKKNGEISGPRIKDKKNGNNSELENNVNNTNVSGPRIKNKKNGENSDLENNVNNTNVSGPRIKDKKNGEFTGPRIKDKKNGEISGPRIKDKKNGENSDLENNANNTNVFGPRIKDKKNGEFTGPRIKDKKNGEFTGPRIKDKKNGNSREFELTIREPWFSLIENGQKTVEGRIFKGIFTEFEVNDTIRFINKWNGKEKSVTAKITKLTKYPNFGDLLFHEELYKVLPGLPNIKCGIALYDKIYKDFNEIKEYGTLAIQLKVL